MVSVSFCSSSCIHEAAKLLGGAEDAASVIIEGILCSRSGRKKIPSTVTWRTCDLIIMKRRVVADVGGIILVIIRSVADMPKLILSGLALIRSESGLLLYRVKDQL